MANGTIAFDTLSTSGQISGTAVSVDADYLAYGSAKAWAALNGSTFGLKDSFNITSATDNGTGDYTFTIANDMANANASLTANSGAATTRSIADCAAGTYELDLFAADGSTRGDSARAFTALHGDLA